MKTCPSCHASYEGEAEKCTLDGTALVDESQLSLSDTMQGEGIAVATGTPGPLVRSRPSLELPETKPDGPDPIVGSTLSGRYQVTCKIGEGGMGAVYEARHLLIGKRVAIKVLLDKYASKADVVARLQQEARLASSIGHEHIVDITDFGQTEDERTFVVMEYLDGLSLAQLLEREGPLPMERAITIIRQVASALGAAHDKGIVHRDIKPENIFICRRSDRDFAKVVDFGISKLIRPPDDADGTGKSSPRLTQTGMVLGTPLYMSPEQARGEETLDHRIDVYALGIILYELVTGEVPYHGTNYLSIISQVLSQEAKPPSEVRPELELPAALDGIILRSIAKERDDRYASMAALDADLARLQTGDAIPAAPRGRGRPPSALRVTAWIAGIAAVLAVTALLVYRLLPSSAPRTPGIVINPPAVAVPTPPPVAPKVEMELTKVSVETDPPGATIFWESRELGVTPTVLDFPKMTDQISVTLRKTGFADADAKFYPLTEKLVKVTLTKAKTPPVIRKPPPKPPTTPTTPEKPGSEIPNNPYLKPKKTN